MGVQIVGLGHALLCPLCPSDISLQGWGKGLRFAKGAFFFASGSGMTPLRRGNHKGCPYASPFCFAKRGGQRLPSPLDGRSVR